MVLRLQLGLGARGCGALRGPRRKLRAPESQTRAGTPPPERRLRIAHIDSPFDHYALCKTAWLLGLREERQP
jgi:hypothetical protein